MPPADAIAAIATAPGRGGVGIVRVSGPALAAMAERLLGQRPVPRVAHFVRFRDAGGALIDEGLALYFAAPASFTGEDVLELHGHGSPMALRLLLRRVLDLGARHAEPGEFTRRAYLNGKLDLAQAEAVADVIDAATESAARAAARSLSGEFSKLVQALRERLIHLRMFVEATLDFPEEDVEFLESERAAEKLAATRAALDDVLAAATRGQLLHDGIRIVLAGAPNVGKSSLLNALAGDDIAIVTPIAGTTRDAIRSRIDIHGLAAEVVDTAGLRETEDPVEAMGIARTRAAIAEADLALVLVEAGSPVPPTLLDELPAALPRLIVHNKIDLQRGATPRADDDGIWLSARTGAGLELLATAITDSVGFHYREEGSFIARERHVDALRRALAHVDAAGEELAHGALELFAEELRRAHEALGTIVGEFTADDLLGEIFSRFCIGK